MQVLCSTVIPTFDDSYHCDIKTATATNCLATHPEIAGDKVLDCRYDIPGFAPIIVPGLSDSAFHSPVIPLFTESGKPSLFRVVKLPGLHVQLNLALKAVQSGADYDWERFRETLEGELLGMLGQVINSRAMRTRSGDGFMALAQANPNQPQDVLGVGADLVGDLTRLCRKRDKTFASSDLNGLLVRTCLRFPATRSSGVKRWMTLRVIGKGRCGRLHPVVLKEHMLGDVDGDEIYAEFDPQLRRVAYDPFTPLDVPSVVTRISSTIGLSDCIGRL